MKRRRNYTFYHFLLILAVISIAIPLIVILLQGPPPDQYYEHHKEDILSAKFSTDGNYLLAGGGRDVAWLHDLESNRIIHHFGNHSRGISSIDLSHDGSVALTMDKDGFIQLWDAQTGERLASFQAKRYDEGHRANPDINSQSVAALSANGDGAVFKDSFGDVHYWNWKQNPPSVFLQEDRPNQILALALSPDSRLVLIGDKAESSLKCYDLDIHSFLFKRSYDPSVSRIQFSPDGAEWHSAGGIKAYRKGSLINEHETHSVTHDDPIFSMAVKPDGTQVLLGGAKDNVKLWDVNQQTLIASFSKNQDSQLDYFTASVEDRNIALAFAEDNAFVKLESGGTIQKCDIRNGKIIWAINGYAASPKGKIIPAPKVIEPSAVEKKKNQRLAAELESILPGKKTFDNTPLSVALNYVIETSDLPFHTDNIKHTALRFYGPSELSGKEFFDRYFKYRLHGLYDYSFDGAKRIALKKHAANIPISETPPEIPELDFRIAPPWEFSYIDCYDLMNSLKKRTGLDFSIDQDLYNPVTAEFDNASVKTYLDAILLPNQLDYVIDSGRIVIDRKQRIGSVRAMREQLAQAEKTSSTYPGLNYAYSENVQANGISLRDFLRGISNDSGIQFSIDPDVSATVSCNLTRPTVAEILSYALPDHGLFFALQKDHTVRVARLNDIAIDTAAIFTPEMLSTLWINYHAQFASSHLAYEGTAPIPPRRIQLEAMSHKRLSSLKRILEEGLNSPNPNAETILAIDESMLPYLKWSDQDIKNKIKEMERSQKGYDTSIKREFWSRGDKRMYQETNPENPDKFYLWNGGQGTLHQYAGEKAPPANFSFAFNIGGLGRMPPTGQQPSNPGTPFRFGNDLDWFMKRGYTIRSIDHETRTVRIQRFGENLDTYYDFTLMDGHNAYWKECRLTFHGQSSERIVCEDIETIDGMMIPTLVRIASGSSSPIDSTSHLLYPHASFAKDGLKLIEASVNDPTLPDSAFNAPTKGYYIQTALK